MYLWDSRTPNDFEKERESTVSRSFTSWNVITVFLRTAMRRLCRVPGPAHIQRLETSRKKNLEPSNEKHHNYD